MSALAKTQDDASVSIRRKAGTLQTNLICSNTKLIGTKETLIIGCYSARLIRQSIAKRGGRARDDGTAAVAHSPFQSSADFRQLSVRIGSAKQRGAEYSNRKSDMPNGNKTASKNHLSSPISNKR
jgi:hypothetical protein